MPAIFLLPVSFLVLFSAGPAFAGPALAERFMNSLNISPAANLFTQGDEPALGECPSAREAHPTISQEQALAEIQQRAESWREAKAKLAKVAWCHRPFRADTMMKNDTRVHTRILRELDGWEKMVSSMADFCQKGLLMAAREAKGIAGGAGAVNNCIAFDDLISRLTMVSSSLLNTSNMFLNHELRLSFAYEDQRQWSSVQASMVRRKPEEALDHLIERRYKINRLPKECGEDFQKSWQGLVKETRALAKAIREARLNYVAPLSRQISSMNVRADCQRSKGDCKL